ncbi:amidase [Kribbella sancticallisti]|uniref:Amidase n=1 Tax=Kribbella sancticallisti TaxID=460087 RepID=A0ABN2DK81_9ACTN
MLHERAEREADELCFRSARELANDVAARRLSATEVLHAHLDRVERVNPALNAIVTVVADQALGQARRLDDRAARGEPVGPLAGLPIAHKDTHETEGIRTTYGSGLYAEHFPDSDELAVSRIRQADAITFGKTNVPEFAAGSHTFNRIFGTTANPYALGRSAGGSSGGAAAALAAGLQPIADGSDMGGSLRNPASFCNVVGLRPSPGRVPSYPSMWPWSTLSVQGPMARSVSDVAFLLSVMAGDDPRSPIALTDNPSAFARPLDADLTGVRVAWAPDLGADVAVDPEVRAVLGRSVFAFADLGCEVIDASPDLSGADEAFRTLRAWQFALSFGELLRDHRLDLKPSLVWNIEQGLAMDADDIARAEQLRARLYHRVREFFAGVDILVCPVSQVPPFPVELEFPAEIDGQPQATYLDWMRSAYVISVTGCPALSVPGGFTSGGLPVGLQIVGPHRQDLRVLQVGHAFEQATGYGKVRPRVNVGEANS